jgi:hypothetical protein
MRIWTRMQTWTWTWTEGRRTGALARTVLPAALLLASCTTLQRAAEPVPPSRPAADEGMLVYTVGALAFEVPSSWQVRGDERHVEAQPPDATAKVDVRLLEQRFKSAAECASQAEVALTRGSAGLANVRRHPTTVAGRRALVQEADAGPWHGWAYAVCDGHVQYRIFVTGLSPVRPETLDAFRVLVSSAQLGGTP